MDIRNVSKSDGVERGSNRGKRAEQKRESIIPSMPRDEAKISASSRSHAASVDRLAARARHAGEERELKIALAVEKLQNGSLDDQAVVRGTAQRLLDAGFVSE